MAYTTVNKSTSFFNDKFYTGTGSTNALTGLGFQPDWVWIKARSTGYDNNLFDSLRGTEKRLKANANSAEDTVSGSLTAFGTDGFTVGSDAGANNNGTTFASWGWKAGTTSIPSGSTSDPSAVSINTTAGFGIYKITAPGSGNYVLKHGLGAAPSMVLVKRTNGTQKWMVWHKTFSNATDDYLVLNTNAAKATYSTCWGTMNTTDCTIATGGTLDTGGEHIIYVFTEKAGYSRFDQYTGNGNADGTFVYTGFKPKLVIVKEYGATGNWIMKYDYHTNQNDYYVLSNDSATEASGAVVGFDLLSNGFKLRGTAGDSNGSGANILYMAFGQSAVGTNNVPCTAR